MANMTFKTNLLPNSDYGYSLGSIENTESPLRWKINGSVNGAKIFYGTCAEAAAAKTVVCPEFLASDLVAGTIIFVKMAAKNTGAVASLTLNVNGTGAKPIKYMYNDTAGNLPAVGYILANQTYIMHYDGTNWVIDNIHYNTNTNDSTYMYMRLNYGTYKPSTALYRYMVCLSASDGETVIPLNTVSNSTATTKTLTTESFDIFKPIFYYSTTGTVNAGTAIGASYLWTAYSNINLSYSFNTGTTLTNNKDVYIVAQLDTPTTAKLATEVAPITQTLPSTDDGYIYIKLGHACSTSNITTTYDHPIYWYRDSKLQPYTPNRGIKTISRSGTTFTVTRDDGSTFTFTQQDNNALNWGQITQSGANNLDEGTSDFTDNTEIFSSYASNNGFADSNATGKVYRRDAIHMYNYVKSKLAVTNNNINLSRNTETTIATIGGTAIKIKLPASDNTDAKVAQTNSTTNADYRILLSGTADDTTRTEGSNKSTNLRFNPSTKVFSVGGSISATGDLNLTGDANLNGETYADSATIGSLLVNGAANFVQIPTSPTPVATSNDTSIATTAFVMNAFTANDAMVFKGVINANSELPANHKQGWTYRIGTAGTYANKVCEIGDIIICVTDGTAANNDHWAVIQNNIDGAVYRGTNAFTDANIIVADSTAGKVKSSGKTITTTAPSSSAADTTIPTSKAVWSAVTAGLGTLDVSSVGGTGKYISAISQTDGKISATATSTSVSNSWTAGTTAGPKIATTVNGVAGTAVAIPTASSTASGVVTTDSQTFAGDKTFNSDNFLIKASTIRFQNKAGNAQQAKQGSDNSTLHPYVTSILIGDNREVTLDEYQDAGLAIHSNKGLFLHTTATPIQIYDPTKTYTVGSLVWYSSNYYKCKNAITTAQEWTAENWDNVSSSNGVIKTDATTFVPLTTNTSSLGTNTIRWKALYIGTTDSYGSATEPIYWSSGVPTKGDKYAGGTAVTLNGTSAAKSTASFYAPTGAGTSGQLLKSNGSGAPTWFTPSYVTSSGVTTITAGTGLNTSADQADSATKGSITTTGTLYLTTSGVTANTYGNTSQQTPSHGGTFNIPYFTVDKYGRVTSASTTTVKLPADSNTDTKVNVVARGTTKAYILADTTSPPSSAAAHTAVAETGVYLTTTAGQLNATSFKVAEQATIQYNTTTGCLEIIV